MRAAWGCGAADGSCQTQRVRRARNVGDTGPWACFPEYVDNGDTCRVSALGCLFQNKKYEFSVLVTFLRFYTQGKYVLEFL